MKLQELYEEKEVNLVGALIDGHLTQPKDSWHNAWQGDYNCAGRKLTSLKGAPKTINGKFYCDRNFLKSLEYVPEFIADDFSCYANQIKSFKDIHKRIKRIHGAFYAENNPIKSHVLGLLKIKDIEFFRLDNDKVTSILNKWLDEPYGNSRILGAQSELIEAGLDDFAQL